MAWFGLIWFGFGLVLLCHNVHELVSTLWFLLHPSWQSDDSPTFSSLLYFLCVCVCVFIVFVCLLVSLFVCLFPCPFFRSFVLLAGWLVGRFVGLLVSIFPSDVYNFKCFADLCVTRT